ncbi:MAG: 3-oxoacyl-ACP reductase FabG [Betaproteobacteria bacterium]|nr:3-oxoacyl-ACP reductase FabG [Betaproteobacteria bacterium]
MSRLQGRSALITGGNTGIGRAIALAYAREGADVEIAWIDREADATSLVREIQSIGRRSIAVRADVTREADVVSLFRDVIAGLGELDIRVSNAGIQRPQAITEMTVDDWDRMMAVHLRGAFLCGREASRHMIPRNNGWLIFTCSQLGYIGRDRYTAYSAAKTGLIVFMRSLAKELAPHGILVNGVSPGLVDTGFDPLSEDVKRAHTASLPLKRLGTPEDMTSAYVFLASDDARYYCGQLLHPNGGEIMPQESVPCRARIPHECISWRLGALVVQNAIGSMRKPRQPGCKRWKRDNHGDQQHDARNERRAGEIDIPHRGTWRRHTFHHEEQEPKRRCGVADLKGQQHDQAEPGEIKAERFRQRKENRRSEHHHRELIHEAA